MDRESMEKRPGIIVVGSQNVGKRTIISRLLPVDFEEASDTSSELLVYGWTINTKYYTADVAIWLAHLHDELSIVNLPAVGHLAALVMVFDVNNPSSLVALQDWMSHTDIRNFDILLCIGNKVDLLSNHPAHIEYKRRLMKKHGELDISSEYGISENEGRSLLGDEEPFSETNKLCIEWCLEHNIEYAEACASNVDFDKCLSVDGDSQGVERIYGALSAHMWPGMVLKSGDKINEPSLPEKEESSEEESDYEQEYEILSSGSTEPWDLVNGGYIESGNDLVSTSGTGIQSERNSDTLNRESEINSIENGHPRAEEGSEARETDKNSEGDESKIYDFEGLENLMGEIGNMRSSLRLMPDFQRREMAANLAMKMAAMFGDSSGGEEEFG